MTYKRIIHNGEAHYGLHFMAHVEHCSDAVVSKDKIKAFLIDLCDEIDMVRFGEPIIERFGEGIEVGISAVQLIETSAIVIHTNDGAKELYLDVFSCKDYFVEDVEKCTARHFGSDDMRLTYEAFYRK